MVSGSVTGDAVCRFESCPDYRRYQPGTIMKDKVGDNWKDNNMGLQTRGFQGGRQPKWGFESPALTIFLIIQPVDPGGLSQIEPLVEGNKGCNSGFVY
jgi:hypothetical protein